MDHIHQLLQACEEGNVSVVQSILDKGADVNYADDDEVTPLQVAAANGQEHIVRLLLMRGAALDQPNTFGWTPLLLASRHGHVNVVALLLQNQADLNAKTKLGVNALTLAACGGHLQTTKLLMEAGIDLQPGSSIGASDCEFSALMISADHGHDAVVRLLLDRGCDINHRTPSMGMNSLMLAALNGYMTTSQILIEQGANPNLTNVNNHTPLQIATIMGKREVQGYLDRKTSNKHQKAQEDIKPDIIEAAKTGALARIREILDDDLTQRDAYSTQDGATPLMFAAMTGRLDIAQFLVDKACDINKQDTVSGWTALMQATYHGKKAVAKLLINAGADVLIPAKNGCTAFDMASLIDDVDTELYRMMAAKAVKLTGTGHRARGSLKGSRQNGTLRGSTSLIPDPEPEEKPKSGLKAWWGRMSNRFRNLKMNRTQNNRLAPMPESTEEEANPVKSSPKHTPSKSHNSPKRSASAKTSSRLVSMTSASMSDLSNLSSYSTIMLETRKSAAVYTLGINSQSANLEDGNLKPVIPPFLPPPTFETDRPKMPPMSTRRSISSLGSTSTLTQMSTRPIIPPMKLLQSYSASTQNLTSSPTSPAPSGRYNHFLAQNYGSNNSGTDKFNQVDSVSKFSPSNDASPSSSAGASGISGSTYRSKGPSSASSSTLTAGSDNLNRSGNDGSMSGNDPLFTRRPPSFPPSINYQRPNVAYNGSVSVNSSSSSGIMPNKQSRSKSQSSSKDSASTLTPSPSPVPKVLNGESRKHSSSHSSSSRSKTVESEEMADPGGILKKLSLERYQPIFEEQEVDMEAFLTLTDQDLTELGISHTDSRHQILTAITELNTGKGLERQHFQDTMTSFQSTMTSLNSFQQDNMDFSEWSLAEARTNPAENSAKSRSS